MNFPKLTPGKVHLWDIDLDGAQGEEILAADEIARARRFKFERDRRRYVKGRAAVRQLLGRYLGQAPQTLVFAYGPAGKPAVEGISFNLAHSGARGLFGVASDDLLGVDIEEAREMPDMEEVAASVFSPGELQFWQRLEGGKRREAFYRLWTCKEAYLKAIGEGIAHRLQKFDVALEGTAAPRIASGAEGVWTLYEPRLEGQFAGAVAYGKSGFAVERFSFGAI